MHILPPLETVKDIAATQQYDVLPLSCEILSDFITPIEAMRILKNVSTLYYMLESAQADDRWGRYTFLGFDPKLEITCIDGKMKAGGLTVRTDDPSQYLRELLSSYRSLRFDYLPSFTGGLVGDFSYDYLKYSEPSVRCGEQDEDSFKDVDLMLFDKVIAFDHVRQKIVLIVNMVLSDVEVGYNKAKLELEQLVSLLKTGEKKQEAPGRLLGEVTPLFSKEQFCAMVETAKHHIREGDIFQIVLHGMKSYFCQDEYGQIAPVYSISAGLDYPGVGPEHAYLHDIGRAEYVAITDEEAVQAFEYLARTEGIIPAIESAHAVAYARKLAPTMGSDQLLVVTISGRGDKDCAAIARYRGEYSTLDNNAQNKVFRIFNDTDGRIYNDGYIILRTPGKTEPDGFRKSANIKVTNKGLSTAFQVCVYLYDLKSVKGLASLDEIATTPIDDFYDKIDYKGYTYYEETGVDAEPVKNESGWLISPQYNLCANAGEFNLVFDFSKVTQKYHSILKFEFEDIYQKKYHQFLYLYFDKEECAALPISKLYSR